MLWNEMGSEMWGALWHMPLGYCEGARSQGHGQCWLEAAGVWVRNHKQKSCGIWEKPQEGLPDGSPSGKFLVFQFLLKFSHCCSIYFFLCNFFFCRHFILVCWSSFLFWFLLPNGFNYCFKNHFSICCTSPLIILIQTFLAFLVFLIIWRRLSLIFWNPFFPSKTKNLVNFIVMMLTL